MLEGSGRCAKRALGDSCRHSFVRLDLSAGVIPVFRSEVKVGKVVEKYFRPFL